MIREVDAGRGGPSPAWGRVYSYVCERILRGEFPGGSFVEEEQISSAMNVSRTPVREAFHRLQAEKFIDLLPRRGALVRQVTASELMDLYEVRRVVEGYSIARICQDRLPLSASIEAAFAVMGNFDHDGDPYKYVLMDRQFHRSIVASPGNVVMVEAYDALMARQLRVGMAALRLAPSRIPRILAQHRHLLDALTAHDEQEARRVLDEHLKPVMNVVSKLPGFSLGIAADPAQSKNSAKIDCR